MSNIPKIRASDLFGGDANIHNTIGCACGAHGDKGVSARGRIRNETLFEPKRESDKSDAENSIPGIIYRGSVSGISTMDYPNKSNLPKEQNV